MRHPNPSEYQCDDCGEIPIQNGVCPHGCPNGKNRMRLAYNYTTTDFAVYAPDMEQFVLFGNLWDEDEDEPMRSLIVHGDQYAIYDVSDWQTGALTYFGRLSHEERVHALLGLYRLRSGIYGIVGVSNADTPSL